MDNLSEFHVQVESEPGTMFSDYQNYGTYGPNFPGFKKRTNRLAYNFGVGK